MAVLKPFTGENRTAYFMVTDLTTIADGFKRHRTRKHFIATPEALAKIECVCPTCGERVTGISKDGSRGHDNRGVYSPKLKRFVVQHYTCAWTSLFNDIFKLHDAGRI